MIERVAAIGFIAKRLLDHPVIYPHMDDRMGSNINGPCAIKVPDWVPSPLGRYYMYFADHKGTYIRLAFADSVTGPWHMHRSGVLDVGDSLFEPVDPPAPPTSEQPDWADDLEGGFLYAHIASPDVHIDESSRTISMYYHGLLHDGDQQTRIAISTDGLTFSPQQPLLGPPYFRMFEYDNWFYAVSWAGKLHRSKNRFGPFEDGPDLILRSIGDQPERVIRHTDVLCIGDTLHVFFSCIGDTPERIFHVDLRLCKDWADWSVGKPSELLRPELAWEGADLPLAKSQIGAGDIALRELRDPCVFQESGRLYLFYCGAGESGGIGLAELSLI